MKWMIAKDWWAYALGIAYALVPLYMLHLDGLDPGGIVFTGCIMTAAVLFGTTIAEKLEGKSDGYRFLFTLPLGARKIVRAKFAAPLVVAVVATAVVTAMLPRFTTMRGFVDAARIAVAFAAVAGLLCVGASYTVLYLSNLNEKVRTIMLILPSGMIVLVLAAYMLMRAKIRNAEFTVYGGAGTAWRMSLIVAVGLVLYVAPVSYTHLTLPTKRIV